MASPFHSNEAPREASTCDSTELQPSHLFGGVQTIDSKFEHRTSIENSSLTGKSYAASSSRFSRSISREIQMLLSEDGERQLGQEIWRDARLKILPSIGVILRNSKTLQFQKYRFSLGMNPQFVCHNKFNLQELEALLRPVQSSAVLEELLLVDQNLFTTEDSWVMLANIIRAVKTLQSLVAYKAGILVPELKLLSEAVAATFPSPLRKLDLRDNDIFNETGGEFFVNLLTSAPNLLELGVGPFTDKGSATQVGSAVACHRSLRTLFLEQSWIREEEAVVEDVDNSSGQISALDIANDPEMTPTDHFLRAAFGGRLRNTGIQNLCIGHSSSKSAFSMRTLSQVLVRDMHIVQLRIACPSGSGYEINSKHVGVNKDDLEWQEFYRALTSNSTIKTLHLAGNVLPQGAEEEFLNWIRTTSLNCFTIEASAAVPWSSVFRALRDNTRLNELKILDLKRAAELNPEDLRELMAMLQVRP